LAAALVPLLVLSSALSYGAMITYTTEGAFNGGAASGTANLTLSSGTLTFLGVSSGSVDPGNLSYGFFASSDISGPATIPAGTTFTLFVTQTTPTSGNSSVAGTLTGTINSTDSTVSLKFETQDINIGGVSYHIDSDPKGVAIVPPNNNGGLTSIQGEVASVAAIPEPSTYLLLGTGFCLITLISRRRSRA
jgi:hypothetical protein